MSVRKETAGSYSNSAGLMKSAFFWMAMLTASFLLGFLVLAPIGQMWKAHADSNTTVQQPNGQKPTSASAATPHSTKKLDVPEDEPVTVTRDPSDTGVDVQSGADPTDSPKHAGGGTTANGETAGGTEEHAPTHSGIRTEEDTPETTDRARRPETDGTASPRVRDRENTDRTSGVRGDRTEQTPTALGTDRTDNSTPPSPRQRSRRSRGNTAAPRTTDDGIQRGEQIDR